MSYRKLLLPLVVFAVLITSCSKKSSSDAPLTPQYNSSIIIGGDNHIIYAIDPLTGLKNWEFSTSAPILASPLIYNGMVYFASSGAIPGDTLYKLNVQTGALIQKIVPNGDAFAVVATPTADANLLYLAGTNGRLYAVDTGTYTVKWTYGAGGPIKSSPVVFGGNVYFGCDDGNVYCVDKTLGPTATTNWAFNPFTAGISATSNVWYSSPAIGYGRQPGSIDTPVLCIGGSDGYMYSLKLYNGSYNFNWRYKTNGPINSSPTIYGGACIFGSADFNVYCVDIIGNYNRWSVPFATHSNVYSSPYANNNIIYVGSNDYNLYAINFLDGTQKWVFHSAGLIKSSPLVFGPYVFVASFDKSFYALDTLLGQKKWTFTINNNIESSPAVDNNTGGFGTNSSQSGLRN